MRRDDAHLLDILIAAERAMETAERTSLDELKEDWRSQAILAHELLVLGEAVKRLSSPFRADHDHIDWSGFAGPRDVLIHQYDRIDYALVWDIVHQELPPLVIFLKSIVPPE